MTSSTIRNVADVPTQMIHQQNEIENQIDTRLDTASKENSPTTMAARSSWAAPAQSARRRGIPSDPQHMGRCSGLSTPLSMLEMGGFELNVHLIAC